MYKSVNIVLVFILTLAVSPSFALNKDNAKNFYNLPDLIQFKVVEKAQAFGKSTRMRVSITSKHAQLNNLKIFFNASKDLKIISQTKYISSLEPNETETINIIAAKTGKEADKLGSWIRVGVSYSPNYDELIRLASDTKNYPEEFLRNQLIDNLMESQLNNEPYLDALRHFIK